MTNSSGLIVHKQLMRNEKGQQKKGDIQINQGAKKGEEIKDQIQVHCWFELAAGHHSGAKPVGGVWPPHDSCPCRQPFA
jgi:hypothetical protein